MDKAVLNRIGVTEDEERVYRALLVSPGITVRALGQRLDMGTARLRRALDGLERKAMVTRRGGAPTTFQPTPPAIVIDTLIAQREEELRRARIEGVELMDLFSEQPEQPQVGEIVEILSTREAVMERWLQLQRATRESLEVLVRPPYAEDRDDVVEDLQQTLVDRGVILRGIYDQGSLDEAVLEHMRVMGSRGEQARVVTDTPMKVAIFDRRAAIVPMALGEPSRIVEAGLVVHESALLDALVWLFDSLWERGAEVRFGQLPDDDRNEEGAVLTLLAAGLKDEAVARHLGVSVKTVRRRVSTALTRLGVATRFQAGLALAREGWVDGQPPEPDAR